MNHKVIQQLRKKTVLHPKLHIKIWSHNNNKKPITYRKFPLNAYHTTVS